MVRRTDDVLRVFEATRMQFLVPCYGFCGGDCEGQLEKVEEEFGEVWKATVDYLVEPSEKNREAFLMECADVQVAVETLMMMLGADEDERLAARRMVWEKNDARGYYDEKC